MQIKKLLYLVGKRNNGIWNKVRILNWDLMEKRLVSIFQVLWSIWGAIDQKEYTRTNNKQLSWFTNY
jgi:hypothetical protein